MAPIKELSLTFDNEGFFSEGDTITGTVSFRLKKDTKVRSISLRATGEASVHWDVGEISFDGYIGYFKEKKYLVAKNSKGKPENVKYAFKSVNFFLKS